MSVCTQRELLEHQMLCKHVFMIGTVRCSVKSNDEKKALTMDLARVQHQVQYLGLAENIKVRRAGFAYRNDFHRFLDRFAILSPATYPEWQGSDLVRVAHSCALGSCANQVWGLCAGLPPSLWRSLISSCIVCFFAISNLPERLQGDPEEHPADVPASRAEPEERGAAGPQQDLHPYSGDVLRHRAAAGATVREVPLCLIWGQK